MSATVLQRTPTAGRRGRFSSLVAVATLAGLLLAPELGLRLFWNLLIPCVPLLLVVSPGWWRNACPLATVAEWGRRWGPVRKRRLGLRAQGAFSLGSVVLLFLLLPLRHLRLDPSAEATAGALLAAAAAAMVLTARFDAKSGWCAGICPVSAVERLYGQKPDRERRNTRCTTCTLCVAVCPDSIPNLTPLRAVPTRWHRAADSLIAGAFAGFVWGWFHVPDGADSITRAYALPLGAGTMTWVLYVALRRHWPSGSTHVTRAFALLAVATYYWFRVPALIGLGHFPGDGVLVDLSAIAPGWVPWLSRIISTTLLAAWFLRPARRMRWLARPPISTAA